MTAPLLLQPLPTVSFTTPRSLFWRDQVIGKEITKPDQTIYKNLRDHLTTAAFPTHFQLAPLGRNAYLCISSNLVPFYILILAPFYIPGNKFEAQAEIMKGYTFIPATTEVDESALHVQAFSEAYEEVTGKKAELYRKHAFCDTIQFSLRGIPAITFGPGEDGWPPINEFIDLDKVVMATKVYALGIPKILGLAK